MSEAKHGPSWLETWWPLLVILYAVLFVIVLVSWHPVT